MEKMKLSPRKEAKQKRSRETVRAILEAATHILNTNGAAGLTTNHIARKAGVSIGSVYQYFPNKDSITSRLFEDFIDEQGRLVFSVLSEVENVESLYEKIPDILKELYRYRTEEIIVARAIAHEISKGQFHRKLMQIKRELSKYILSFFNELFDVHINAINQIKVDLMVDGMDNMIFYMAEKEMTDQEVEESISFMLRILKNGINELEK